MKSIITFLDSGIKKQSSKAMKAELESMQQVFTAFIKKNPHFKGVKEFNLTITLCGKTKIKNLNRDYRNKDYVTDVLSFPVYENLRPDRPVLDSQLPFMELGDLVICKEVAKFQAREFDITYEQEIIHLAVHGFLHLLGFDHEISKKEEEIMEKHEADLVKKIYKKLAVKK